MFHLEYKFLLEILGFLTIKVNNNRYHHITFLIIVTDIHGELRIAFSLWICEKLVKFTGIFYRLRSKISCEWLRNIYYSFVYPHLLYGIEMYANTCVTYLDKLIKLNNKILRILQKCPIRAHVLELYDTKFNVLPLDKLHNYQIILLVFKCLNYANLLPPMYANYFVVNVTTIVYPGHLRSWSMRQFFRIGPRIDSHKGNFF